MDNLPTLFLAQLLPQTPTLVAYLAGIILSIVFWKRFPNQCLMTLIASTLMLATTLSVAFVNIQLLHNRQPGTDSPTAIFAIIGFMSGVLRASAFGLLLAAVFTGRRRT